MSIQTAISGIFPWTFGTKGSRFGWVGVQLKYVTWTSGIVSTLALSSGVSSTLALTSGISGTLALNSLIGVD